VLMQNPHDCLKPSHSNRSGVKPTLILENRRHSWASLLDTASSIGLESIKCHNVLLSAILGKNRIRVSAVLSG